MPTNIYGTKLKDKIEQDSSSFPKSGEFRPNIFGLEGDDTIIAYQANVIGGEGNDLLISRRTSAADFSVLSYPDSPAGITVNLLTKKILDGYGGTDTIEGYFPQIWGTKFDDKFILDDQSTGIFTNGGHDTVIGNKNGQSYIFVADVKQWSINVLSENHFLATNTVTNEKIDATNIYYLSEFGPTKIRAIPLSFNLQQLTEKGLVKDVSIIKSIDLDYSNKGDAIDYKYYLRSALVADLNGDLNNEVVITVSPYPQKLIPITIMGIDGALKDLTSIFFPEGTPKVMASPSIQFTDINGDKKNDLIFADSGLDTPPWTGTKIAVALNQGNYFKDVSSLIADTTLRNYAVGVGDFNGDSKIDIFLGAQENRDPSSASLLTYENSKFISSPNPVELWNENRLFSHGFLRREDFNQDGYDDLLIGGADYGVNNAIVYGDKNGLNGLNFNHLPEGPYTEGGWTWSMKDGNWPPKVQIDTAETNSISFDFNGDGRPDIFSVQQQAIRRLPGTFVDPPNTNGEMYYANSCFYALTNVNGTTFKNQSSNTTDLPYRFYYNIFAYDINEDGFKDVVGNYFSVAAPNFTEGQLFSTTFFVNDGHGNFTVIDGVKAFPQLASYPYANSTGIPSPEVGAIFPISNKNGVFTGVSIIPEAYQTGKYTFTQFTTSSIQNLKPDVTTKINPIIETYGNFTISGTTGIDAFILSDIQKSYSLSKESTGLFRLKSNHINDILTGVERLKFSDKSIAIDITGNAGTTAKILGAVFGKDSISNKNYVGIGLHFLDAGWSYDNLAVLALDAAGAKTNDQIVSLLWTNVIGSKPTATDKAPYISLLENGMTAGALAHLAADSSYNITNINLVGLAQTGIEYIPIS